MGGLIRAFDWANTPVGPPETWPQSLRLTIRLMLNTQHPMFIWWGDDLIQFYNDAYRQTMGPEMHPSALGARGRECWADIWPIIGPQIELVMAGKGSTWNEDQLVPITRHGGRQDVWWTYGFSPIDLDDRVGGVLVVCNDVTQQHLQTRALKDRTNRMAQQFEEAPGFIAVLRGPDHVIELANAAYRQLIGERNAIGKPVREAFPEVEEQGFVKLLDKVFRTGKSHTGRRIPVVLKGTESGSEKQLYLNFVYQAITESDGTISGVLVEGQDVTEHVTVEQRLALINRELQHRVRNILTMVGAVASQTLRDAAGEQAMSNFNARLSAFAAAQDALTESGEAAALLSDVVKIALAPHSPPGERYRVSGPRIVVGSKQATSIALIMHELATNAAKYGALSSDTGQVELRWWVEDRTGMLHLHWKESGGPAVEEPTRAGFGTRLVKGLVVREFGGTIDVQFVSTGLHVHLTAPLENLSGVPD